MPEFHILPILGTKTDVPINDISLMKPIAEGVVATHSVGPVNESYNWDASRRRNACSKALGRNQWSKSANAQATKCLGLFELDDETNQDHLFWDNGKLYVFDGDKDPSDVTTAATTYQKADSDLVSMIKVGSDVVFTDNVDGVTLQAWANGDANAAKAIHQYTEFKFRYLEYFARRIIGVYSNQTNGDIDIRWSNALPVAQTDCYFESSNGLGDWQLYVPNDDPITGIRNMGHNACYIYCKDSINQLIYYPNFTTPFQIYTTVQKQGSTGHHSIVSLGDRHYFFNRNYGFVEYRGGPNIVPISEDIDDVLSTVNPKYMDLIVGAFAPFSDEIYWTVPLDGESMPSDLVIYNYRTNQWRFSPTDARYLDAWDTGSTYSWNALATDLANAGYGGGVTANVTWDDLFDWMGEDVTWKGLASPEFRTVMANTDGHLYQFKGEAEPGPNFTAYRTEPALDFGNLKHKKLLNEIWFDIGTVGDFPIEVWHRSGDTVGECKAVTWTKLEAISCNSPEVAAVRGLSPSKGARFHQIKWGNETNSSKFQVNRISFIFELQAY
jgi:hypothetical protein